MKGKPLTLSCSVDARPEPTRVKWTHDHELVAGDGQHTFAEGGLHLVMNSLSKEDDGSYCCIAENSIGEGVCDSAYALKVLCKYSIILSCSLEIRRGGSPDSRVVYGVAFAIAPVQIGLWESDLLGLGCGIPFVVYSNIINRPVQFTPQNMSKLTLKKILYFNAVIKKQQQQCYYYHLSTQNIV